MTSIEPLPEQLAREIARVQAVLSQLDRAPLESASQDLYHAQVAAKSGTKVDQLRALMRLKDIK